MPNITNREEITSIFEKLNKKQQEEIRNFVDIHTNPARGVVKKSFGKWYLTSIRNHDTGKYMTVAGFQTRNVVGVSPNTMRTLVGLPTL
jgi:hypothetical protein